MYCYHSYIARDKNWRLFDVEYAYLIASAATLKYFYGNIDLYACKHTIIRLKKRGILHIYDNIIELPSFEHFKLINIHPRFWAISKHLALEKIKHINDITLCTDFDCVLFDKPIINEANGYIGLHYDHPMNSAYTDNIKYKPYIDKEVFIGNPPVNCGVTIFTKQIPRNKIINSVMQFVYKYSNVLFEKNNPKEMSNCMIFAEQRLTPAYAIWYGQKVDVLDSLDMITENDYVLENSRISHLWGRKMHCMMSRDNSIRLINDLKERLNKFNLSETIKLIDKLSEVRCDTPDDWDEEHES